MRFHLWLLTAILFTTTPAFSLTTAYVSFDHPEGWRCELSQGVWICQSTAEKDRKESVVLSIATISTEWDTLENYEEYLKQARPIQDEDGNTVTATVSYSRKRNINGHTWVDSLQHNSELPGFWARYLATIHTTNQTKLAILVTYIVSDEYYAQLAPQFERMVSSLKPNADIDLNVASKQGDGPLPGSTKLGPLQKSILADRLKKKEEKKEGPASDPMPLSTLLMVVVGAVAIIVLILSRRKKRGKKGGSQSGPPGPAGGGPSQLGPRR